MTQTTEFAQWEIKALWDYMNAHQEEIEEEKELKLLNRNIKYGFKIKVPIGYFCNKLFQITPTAKSITVAGKKIPLDKWWEEEDVRKKYLILLAEKINEEDNAPFRPRDIQ